MSVSKRLHWLVFSLCLFVACLNFKPSDPYLSEFLICQKDTEQDICSDLNEDSCTSTTPCSWQEQYNVCSVTACCDVPIASCGKDDYDYCKKSHDDTQCTNAKCYKGFSEDQVNDDIYPWSTYAYLPFLLILGPFSELYSYTIAILFGICGRIVTRFLLLYGSNLTDMQLMQVTYSLGTAAEDVFAAYIYYVVPPSMYQSATSYIKASALIACVLSGVLGDLLVVEGHYSLNVLMWVSALFVCLGFVVGLYVLQAPMSKDTTSRRRRRRPSQRPSNVTSDDQAYVFNSDEIVNLLAPDTTSSNTQQAQANNTITSDASISSDIQSDPSTPTTPVTPNSSNTNNTNNGSVGFENSSLTTPSSLWDHNRSFYANSNASSRKINTPRQNNNRRFHNATSNTNKSPHNKHSFSSAGSSDYDDGEEDDEEAEQGGGGGSYMARMKALIQRRGQQQTQTSVIRQNHAKIARRRGKIAVFRRQMSYLFMALRNRSLLVTLLLWMVGNAVYTVLYNYEVSVYEELHGSNAWNGSVLAAMLLLGSVGAMCATWMHPENNNNNNNSPRHNNSGSNEHEIDSTSPVSERSLSLRVSAALILSSACLFLFVGAWKTLPSVAFLGLFFGTWQYVNVTVYAQLALHLKVAQLSCSKADGPDRKDSLYSRISTHSTDTQNNTNTNRKSLKSNTNNNNTSRKERTTSDASDARYSFGNMLDHNNNTISTPQRTPSTDYDLVDTCNTYTSPLIHHNHTTQHGGSISVSVSNPIVSVMYNNSSENHNTNNTPQHNRHNNTHNNSTVNNTNTNSTLPLQNDVEDEVENGTERETSSNVNAQPAPPYSIAIVSVIALCVVIQIILQFVLFTYLELSLRHACFILVSVFCAVTILYVIYTVFVCTCCVRDGSSKHNNRSNLYKNLMGERSGDCG